MIANLGKSLIRRTGLKRSHVAYARMYCERNFLAFSRRRSSRETGRILAYHTVGQPQWGVNDVSPTQFRRHIELALDAGLRFVPASALARNAQDKREIAITFDDAMRSVLTQAAPLLAEYQIPWSVFVVSDWAEGIGAYGHDMVLNWSELEQVMKLGAEIGSHSVSHPNFGKLEASRVTDELESSRRMIEARLGFTPTTFAIPFGQSKDWPALAAAAARDIGYEIVYAQAEETRPPGTVPRTFVTSMDGDRIFKALLAGAYDRWEEWY
jgi:peptidoglycan/xylan/chitin deacetylase (PgdA/CDA1 family)